MATQQPEGVSSRPAAADLTARQWHFVVLSNEEVALCGAGARAVGVLQNAPELGDDARYNLLPGRAGEKIKCGGNIALGAKIMSNASGRAVTATSGNQVLGIAGEAGADGRVITFTPSLEGALP